MRFFKAGFFVFAVIVLFALYFYFPCSSSKAFADNWWEEEGKGTALDRQSVDKENHSASRVNWEDGYIEVMAGGTVSKKETVNMAQAVSVATKTARHLAYEKLSETVAGINITSNATYDRELMMDSNLKTAVQALIKNARVVKEEQRAFPDGSTWVEVTLGLKLIGEKGLAGPTTKWVLTSRKKAGTPVQTQKTAKIKPDLTPIKYTGLIVDAGGFGGVPAMAPRIISESGAVIYDGNGVKESYLTKIGIVGYKGSFEKAKSSDRVGKNPLLVKAAGISGEKKADIVISDDDAGKILGSLKNGNFLKECRVAVVLN